MIASIAGNAMKEAVLKKELSFLLNCTYATHDYLEFIANFSQKHQI